MVKAHGKFWPEVGKAEPILADLEGKWNELSQSHLSVMGLFMRMRGSRDFSENDTNLMLGRMAEFRKDIVDLDPAGTFEWRTKPATGIGARIINPDNRSRPCHVRRARGLGLGLFKLRATGMEGIPTREACVSDEDFNTKLSAFWESVNRSDPAPYSTTICT